MYNSNILKILLYSSPNFLNNSPTSSKIGNWGETSVFLLLELEIILSLIVLDLFNFKLPLFFTILKLYLRLFLGLFLFAFEFVSLLSLSFVVVCLSSIHIVLITLFLLFLNPYLINSSFGISFIIEVLYLIIKKSFLKDW